MFFCSKTNQPVLGADATPHSDIISIATFITIICITACLITPIKNTTNILHSYHGYGYGYGHDTDYDYYCWCCRERHRSGSQCLQKIIIQKPKCFYTLQATNTGINHQPLRITSTRTREDLGVLTLSRITVINYGPVPLLFSPSRCGMLPALFPAPPCLLPVLPCPVDPLL